MQDQAHDLDALAAFVEGRLDEPGRQRVIAHATECLECRRTLAHLSRAVADGTLAPKTTPGATSFRWSNTRVWLPVAASVLIGTFAWFRFAMPPDLATDRDGAGDAQGTAQTPDTPPSDDDLLRTRSGGRTVAGRAFRLTSGEWVDATFDPAAGLPTVVIRGAEERRNWLGRIPELAPFAELGDRVLVVWQGTAYRFEP